MLAVLQLPLLAPNSQRSNALLWTSQCTFLTLELKVSADLVAGLIELVEVERKAETERGTRIELGIVGERRNTAIVDLALGEAKRIELVLGCKLQAAGLAGVDIVADLGADFRGGIHLLVVGSGDDAKVLGCGEVGDVAWSLVSEADRVLGDSGFLEVVASLASDEEALVGSHDIDHGIDITAGLSVVDESAGVDVRILEGQGQLLRGRRSLAGIPEVLEVDLDAGSNNVAELDLGIEEGGGSVGLDNSNAWYCAKCQRVSFEG